MRQSLVYCMLALLCLGGAFVGQVVANETGSATKKTNQPVVQSVPSAVIVQTNPAVASQVTVPVQMRSYTRSDIRSMPLLSRPNRPGHFIGNTIRRRNSR